jgi:hypothetical protein
MKHHPLGCAVTCRYCGKGRLEFVRSRQAVDLYRCRAEQPCRGFTLHYRRGQVCGTAAELHLGVWVGWQPCQEKPAGSWAG